MHPHEFLDTHQIHLTPEESALYEQGIDLMARSIDPHHDATHIARLLESLDEFIRTDEFRRLAGNVDLKVIFIAILWHDCWRAHKETEHCVPLFWLTVYEGIGASRHFDRAARSAGVEPAFCKAVTYAIRKHSLFQFWPIKTLEAKILKVVDALDMYSLDRTYLLEKKYLLDRPITPATYNVGLIVIRLFAQKDPRPSHYFEWSQKLAELRPAYLSRARKELAEYKMLCDLQHAKHIQEFEQYLAELQDRYVFNPEYVPEAVYIGKDERLDAPF